MSNTARACRIIFFACGELSGAASIFLIPYVASWLCLALTGHPLNFGGGQ